MARKPPSKGMKHSRMMHRSVKKGRGSLKADERPVNPFAKKRGK